MPPTRPTRILIVVSDEGEGIPQELRRRVFTKFWKGGARGGSGLGLYIVGGLTRAHGGSVEIDDAPGGGARITVRWPVGEPLGELTRAPAPTPPGDPVATAAATFLDLAPVSGPNSNYDPVEVTDLKPEEVEASRDAALAAIAAATDLEALKQVRIAHTGDRSPLALANREIGALPPQARKEAGRRIGQARGAVNQALAARQAVLEVEHEERMLVEETVDVTLPTTRTARGSRHPITLMSDHIADLFVAMGWEVAEGPVVEAEWLNFDALNLGPDHPARTMQDTFWTEPADHHVVLRTHTSPVQARTMLTREPPIYVICPGRVFRTDEYDATHSPMFHQVEGLVVDHGITMAHLKGTLDHFATQCSARASPPASGRRTSRSPSRPPRSTWSASCAAAERPVSSPAAPARARAGSSGAAAAWSTRGCSPRAASTPRPTPASRSAWASTGPSCSTAAPRACATSSRATSGSARPSERSSDMRAPVSWIREYVDLPADATTDDLAARLTALGLKLEALHRPGDAITGPLVIGRVLTMEAEPQKNGKTINWCTVDVGRRQRHR